MGVIHDDDGDKEYEIYCAKKWKIYDGKRFTPYEKTIRESYMSAD